MLQDYCVPLFLHLRYSLRMNEKRTVKDKETVV